MAFSENIVAALQSSKSIATDGMSATLYLGNLEGVTDTNGIELCATNGRRESDSNRRMRALQARPLPLGYPALFQEDTTARHFSDRTFLEVASTLSCAEVNSANDKPCVPPRQ